MSHWCCLSLVGSLASQLSVWWSWREGSLDRLGGLVLLCGLLVSGERLGGSSSSSSWRELKLGSEGKGIAGPTLFHYLCRVTLWLEGIL